MKSDPRSSRRRAACPALAASWFLPTTARVAWGQGYPTGPTKLVVAGAAGGPAERLGRATPAECWGAPGRRWGGGTGITDTGGAGVAGAAAGKEAAIISQVPNWMRRLFADFAGMPGSKIYRVLSSGEARYGVIRAQKA